jgi:HD-GYP domain-containing protein (c-di-GMP phosphodiesterase class II)
LTGLQKRLRHLEQRLAKMVNGWEEGMVEAQKELQAETARLPEIWNRLEEENARLSEAEKQLSADNERLSEEQKLLVEENAQLHDITKKLNALTSRLVEAEKHLTAENKRLSESEKQLLEENARLTEVHKEIQSKLRGAGGRQATPERHRDVEDGEVAWSPEVQTQPEAHAPRNPNPQRQPDAHPARVSPPQRQPVVEIEPEPEPEPADQPSGVNTLEEVNKRVVNRALALLRENHEEVNRDEQALTLGRALDAHSAREAGFSERLAKWAEATARALGSRPEDMRDIRRAALLHDIGKIGVPAASLPKPGAPEDEALVMQLPIAAEKILHPIKGMHQVGTILRHRYERWDGKGHPDGLKGDRIPVGSRILAVAKNYGELTHGGQGKPKLYHLDAMVLLKRATGSQFDPKVVEAFGHTVRQTSDT